jgi:hypothetical protein
MVLLMLFLMVINSRCCSSFIAVRIVVVSSGCGQRGTLSVFRRRLRLSERASCANQQPIDGWLALAAPAGIGRARQCHWFSALKKRITAYLTDTWRKGVVAGFDYFLQLDQIPVSRAI